MTPGARAQAVVEELQSANCITVHMGEVQRTHYIIAQAIQAAVEAERERVLKECGDTARHFAKVRETQAKEFTDIRREWLDCKASEAHRIANWCDQQAQAISQEGDPSNPTAPPTA